MDAFEKMGGGHNKTFNEGPGIIAHIVILTLGRLRHCFKNQNNSITTSQRNKEKETFSKAKILKHFLVYKLIISHKLNMSAL